MSSEEIKERLGEAATAQADAGPAEEDKALELAWGDDDTMVPIDKYDGEKHRAAHAEDALRAVAEAMKALGGSGDPAKLGEDVARAQANWETIKDGYEQKISGIRRETALRMALAGKVHDPADVIGRLELDKLEVGEDGSLNTDLGELLRPLRESKPYLFKEERQPEQLPLRGAKPAPVGGEKASKRYTIEELGKLTMEEYAVYRSQQDGFPKN